MFFFFKQKTAYEMRISDWSSDVCSSDLAEIACGIRHAYVEEREIIEGAAAVGIAALLAGKLGCQGPTVLLLSGRNIDMALHAREIGRASCRERVCQYV